MPGPHRALGVCLIVGLFGLTAVASPAAATDAPRLTYFGSLPKLDVGGEVAFNAWNVPTGAEKVIVTSPALTEPVPLSPMEKGSTTFVQTDRPGRPPYAIRDDVSPGTYPVTAASQGHTIATARLTVVARGMAAVDRFVIHPKSAGPCSNIPAPVRPGSSVKVLIADRRLGLDDDTLTIESPVFKHPLTVKKGADDPGCKGDDGATVYGGHATLAQDIPAGQYPMTVVGRHRRQGITQQVTLAGKPVSQHEHPWLIGAAIATGVITLAAVGGFIVRHKRRAADTSS